MKTGTSVLVIDDEPGLRDMLAYELSQEGFYVETAENGIVAVEKAKKQKFDLAVTDFKMPGMDGAQTVEALRAIDPDIEVIVATGYATVETAISCMKNGAYDYVQKPYNLDEMKGLLEKAMDKSHLQGVVALYKASRMLLSALNQPATVQLLKTDHQVMLTIRDTTLTLSPEELKTILAPCGGADVHTERVMPLNISLALVHQFLRRNGSSLRIRSDKDRGTTFEITFPSEEQ